MIPDTKETEMAAIGENIDTPADYDEFEEEKEAEWVDCGCFSYRWWYGIEVDVCGGFMRFNPVVFLSSCAILIAFVAWSMIDPKGCRKDLTTVSTLVYEGFSWLYIAAVAAFGIFDLYLMLTPYGDIILGKYGEKPRFSMGSWFSMLFSAGIGIGLFFFGMSEPLAFYSQSYGKGWLYPTRWGNQERYVRAVTSLNVAWFHWGFAPSACYCIVGLPLAYLVHVKKMPCTMKTVFYPLLGEATWGIMGDIIDIISIFGTMFGVVTSLGLGILQMNTGLDIMFAGVEKNITTQVVMICCITLIATVSVFTGLDYGIKLLSNVNFMMGIFVTTALLFMSDVWVILEIFTETMGQHLWLLIDQTFHLDAFGHNNFMYGNVDKSVINGRDSMSTGGYTKYSYTYVDTAMGSKVSEPTGSAGDAAFIHGWTVFYWAWWISWAPFVGIFIAQISKGRSIKEFILGNVFVPSFLCFAWMAIYGGLAIQMEMEAESLGLGGNWYMDNPDTRFMNEPAIWASNNAVNSSIWSKRNANISLETPLVEPFPDKPFVAEYYETNNASIHVAEYDGMPEAVHKQGFFWVSATTNEYLTTPVGLQAKTKPSLLQAQWFAINKTTGALINGALQPSWTEGKDYEKLYIGKNISYVLSSTVLPMCQLNANFVRAKCTGLYRLNTVCEQVTCNEAFYRRTYKAIVPNWQDHPMDPVNAFGYDGSASSVMGEKAVLANVERWGSISGADMDKEKRLNGELYKPAYDKYRNNVPRCLGKFTTGPTGGLVTQKGASGEFGTKTDYFGETIRLSCMGFTDQLFVYIFTQPFPYFIAFLTFISICTYFITSSDSGSHVIDMVACNGNEEPPKCQRIWWAVLEGAVAAMVLAVGGEDALKALRSSALIAALPFTFVMIAMMFSTLNLLNEHKRKTIKEQGSWPPPQEYYDEHYRLAKNQAEDPRPWKNKMGASCDACARMVGCCCGITSELSFLECFKGLVCPCFVLYETNNETKVREGGMFMLCLSTLLAVVSVLFLFLSLTDDVKMAKGWWGLGIELWIAFALIMTGERSAFREKFNLQGNGVSDCFGLVFCWPCAACQQRLEANDRSEELTTGADKESPPSPRTHNESIANDLVDVGDSLPDDEKDGKRGPEAILPEA